MVALAPLVAALAMALVHVFSPRLVLLNEIPRSRWLSAAGGISTAYVFVHLLPELARHQAESFSGAGAEIFLIAMLGLMAFYGLERWAKSLAGSDDRHRELSGASFWLHLGAFALYNLLIGYLLPERIRDDGAGGFAIYAFAMIVHFIVNDRGLFAHHGQRYLKEGRWVLAVAPFAGIAMAEITELPTFTIGGLLAFLGGGVILNVLKEELPEQRQSRFWAFAIGALAYAAVLFFFV